MTTNMHERLSQLEVETELNEFEVVFKGMVLYFKDLGIEVPTFEDIQEEDRLAALLGWAEAQKASSKEEVAVGAKAGSNVIKRALIFARRKSLSVLRLFGRIVSKIVKLVFGTAKFLALTVGTIARRTAKATLSAVKAGYSEYSGMGVELKGNATRSYGRKNEK